MLFTLSQQREFSLLEKQGLIQAFEYTHELACNVMKDFFENQEDPNIRGSLDATRSAFQNRLISEGEIWMAMINARNLTSHAYDKNTAEQVVQEILKTYHQQFLQFEETVEALAHRGE